MGLPGSDAERSRRLGLVLLVAAVIAAVLAGGTGPAGASSSTLQDVRSRIDALDARIRTLSVDVAALQSDLDAMSSRIQTASDRAGRVLGHLAWLEGVNALLPHGDPGAATAMVARLRRERAGVARAERAVRKVMSEAKRVALLPKLFDAQNLLAEASADRDAALQEEEVLTMAQSGGPAQAGLDDMSYDAWARLFLQKVGAPTCTDNLVAVVSWEVAERTRAAWNPLATTLTWAGSTTFNGARVKNYPSLQAGLEATAQTLWRGYSTNGYGWILYWLSGCADATTTAQAINNSRWCFGCAGGSYVVGLVPDVRAWYARYAGL